MFNVFNMGIGMCAFVDQKDVEQTLRLLRQHQIFAAAIGEVIPGEGEVILC